MDIQPIETHYNGYRFRSRLEARWAVFFDSLGVKYEYEYEGYAFDGFQYLPDFYLPDYDCFVEIKPLKIDAAEQEKVERFGAHKKAFLVSGSPGKDSYSVQAVSDDFWNEGKLYFCKGRKCDRLWLAGDAGCFAINCKQCPEPKCGDNQTSEHFGLDYAYETARETRFEHGERKS